jgi:ferredoxin
LKEYGTVNIASCFNCGNCSAVCPLSSTDDNFPRRMIRYGQLGMAEPLLNSKELWMCYSCGDCTSTCPRQADPSEYMAAARRYAIAKYDLLGLARLLYTSSTFNVIFTVALAIIIGLFFYSFHGPMPGDSLRLFEFIPAHLIHDSGIIAGIIVILITLLGMANMITHLYKEANFPKGIHLNWPAALWETIVVEGLAQARYRKDCEMYGDVQPWYLQKWFLHASMLWGFLGLLMATALDYLFDLIGIRATGTWVPIWYPIRLLGTLAGILLLYGVTVIIIKRLWKVDVTTTHSAISDWTFLLFLWLGGVTGFALEISLYLPQSFTWGYWVLLAHLIVVVELLVLIPFTKFAHVFYRTVALYFHALKPVPEVELTGAHAMD